MSDKKTPMEDEVKAAADDLADSSRTAVERVSVAGSDLIKTVQALLREGMVRKITIQDKTGRTLLEIPLYAGVAGALLLGYATVLALIAAWFAQVSILIERDKTMDEHTPTVVGDAIERAASSISTKTSEVAGSVSALFSNAARTASDATRRAADTIEGRLSHVAGAVEEAMDEAGEAVQAAKSEAQATAEPRQCLALTKSGARCKRMALPGSNYCSTHATAG